MRNGTFIDTNSIIVSLEAKIRMNEYLSGILSLKDSIIGKL